MKIIRTRQSTVIGLLGFLAFILFGIVYLIVPPDLAIRTLMTVGMIYFGFLSFFGLTASWIAFDADQLLIKNGHDYSRTNIADITRIRTFPIFWYVGVLTIYTSHSTKLRTLVADQDLTWIMSRAPSRAITPYWKKKTSGQQTASSNH